MSQKELDCFCKNVVKLRQERGFTKKKMAAKLGISIATLTKIERGTVPPRTGVEILYRIHNEFGVLPSELFEE